MILYPTSRPASRPLQEGEMRVDEDPNTIAVGEFLYNITPIIGPVNILKGGLTGESLQGNKVGKFGSSLEAISIPIVGKIKPSAIKSVQSESNVVKQAEKMSKQAGKNSTTIKTVNGHVRYDMAGKAHKHKPSGIEIKTPHKITYKKHYKEILDKHGNKKVYTNTSVDKNPTPMTQEDIRNLRKYMEKLAKDKK